ncbi:MAG TPA: hypothetical protein VMB53_01055 [Gaiellaceae bacterium]|nr:hypothetical protein [Gaiellaceae bacterium]
MRRLALICASSLVLAVPAAGLAASASPGDGSLVVKNGSAPKGVPVITLVIKGAAIGRVTGQGTIVIDDATPQDSYGPEVTGWDTHKDSGTATRWVGVGMKFRAVGGTYKITIYGSGVYLSAIGQGRVVSLAGIPDQATGDGVYSFNDDPFRSLPATPLVQVPLAAPAANG